MTEPTTDLHAEDAVLQDAAPANRTRPGPDNIRAALAHAPLLPGIYRMIAADGEILYIGKARQLKSRLTNYANVGTLEYRILRMVNQVARVEYTITHTEAEALLLEANLIKHHQPRYNVLLKDDKSFPYIVLTKHPEFPQIAKHRGIKTRGMEFFGPFASAFAVNETIAVLQKAFLLRPCPDTVMANRARPCLQYQIKRCSAPCVHNVSVEEYAGLLKQARDFLGGKSREVQETLQNEMAEAASAMDYERAARLRDRLSAVTKVVQQRGAAVQGVGDADLVGMVRSGPTTCITLTLVRGGQHYGRRTYFPAHSLDRDDGEVMNAFLGQFYAGRPVPRLILVSHKAQEQELLQEALIQSSGHKVELCLPIRGARLRAVSESLEDAKLQLMRRVAEETANGTALKGVSELFGITTPLCRIEIYDNSHISGTHAVGGMVVAGPEGFMKKHYRAYNFPAPGQGKEEGAAAPTGGDDFAMMRQMLGRRLKRLKEEDIRPGNPLWPDLLLIDGGLGQLNAVLEIAEAAGLKEQLKIVGIAKGVDRNAGREQFFLPGRTPFQLPVNDPILHYLQRLRDEAHRFAIGAHRNKRSKAIEASPLDSIEGIGPTRKKALLRHFGSARGVSNASLAELSQVTGVSKQLAEIIYGHFHS